MMADDVIWTFNSLKKDGRPFYRFYYKNIARAVKQGPHRVRFEFTGPPNRELPHITGQLPVMSKKWWSTRDFSKRRWSRDAANHQSSSLNSSFVEMERVRDWWGQTCRQRALQLRPHPDRLLPRPDRRAGGFQSYRYDIRRENTRSLGQPGMNSRPARPRKPRGWTCAAHGNAGTSSIPDAQCFRRCCAAIAYAFDFEWSNKNLFYGQYARTNSFFSTRTCSNQASDEGRAHPTRTVARYNSGLYSPRYTRRRRPTNG